MGMRRGVGLGLVALLVVGGSACGGGDGDGEQAIDAEVALATGPIVDLDPCELLDRGVAASLTGAEVAPVEDAPLGTALAGSIGCRYRLADDDAGTAIAASLVLGGTGAEPDAAEDARVAELTPGLDDPEVVDVDLGDAGAVVTTDAVIQVVYVVEAVVVSIEVAPVGGVDDDDVFAVVEFAEATVDPVREAFEEKQRSADDDDSDDVTTTSTATDDGDDDEVASGDGDVVQQGEIEGLWTGDWGTMAIEVDGDEVRAAYTHDDGRITGTFEDGVFRGRWTEIPSRTGPSDAGSVEFTFAKTADDTIALDGRWDYDGDAERLGHDDWDLTLSADEVPEELIEAFEDEASFEDDG